MVSEFASGGPVIPDWQVKANIKRGQRDDAVNGWGLSIDGLLEPGRTNVKYFPRECRLLKDVEIEITETAPTLLLRKIADRIWTAEQVLRAFISRAAIAHPLTNPLTEIFFDEGLKRARELDENLRTTGKVVGPLHGLPVSLKDVFHIAGHESTMGYVAWIGNIEPKNDTVVDLLWNAGVVFYCKTNVPQTLMSGECVNFIYGRTSTPWNTGLTAGGSSGGEGALISLGGSPLGLGSDIAGSIRTPANFNGIYGLCPSPNRFPGHRADKSGGDTLIKGVVGPLARSLDGLELYARTILSFEPWKLDQQVLRLPWSEEMYEEGLGNRHKLCFAFMAHDKVVLPNTPIIRCMKEVREAVLKAGHQVIDLEPFDGQELMELAFKIFNATGGKEVRSVVESSGEPLIKEISLPSPDQALSALEYMECASRLTAMRQKYLEIVNNTFLLTESGRPVDAIILPSGGTVAPPHGKMEYFTYEAISNVLDWTCATIPVGFVDSKRDIKPKDFTPMSDYDQRNYNSYSPERYKDAPVCLQVMGLQHCEEKVLGVLRVLDKALGRGEFHNA